MTEAFTNIIGEVPKQYKYLLKKGILCLPISLFYKDYEKNKNDVINKIRNNINMSSNSMHKYTSEIPFEINEIEKINNILWYFIREYYELWNEKMPKYSGGFSLIYNNDFDKKLDLHIDDSIYTINMCIQSKNIEGSNIIFNGTKSNYITHEYNPKEICVIPSEDYMLIHLGNHPHRTEEIVEGERINIVFWFK
jgi:hypothetical protein